MYGIINNGWYENVVLDSHKSTDNTFVKFFSFNFALKCTQSRRLAFTLALQGTLENRFFSWLEANHEFSALLSTINCSKLFFSCLPVIGRAASPAGLSLVERGQVQGCGSISSAVKESTGLRVCWFWSILGSNFPMDLISSFRPHFQERGNQQN